MKSKLEQYKEELADLMETKNSPDTPKDIKDAIAPAIEKVKAMIMREMIKAEESKPSPKPTKSVAKVEKKAPVAKKSPAAKKSGTALERCKEILAKYRDKKKTDAKRVEKRRKSGKPAELTPSETINKAAKSVKAKVVEMDKGLKVSEETAIINGVISSVVSAMAGIKDNHRKKMFIAKIIEGLRKLEKGVSLKRAEDGMYLHNIEGSEVQDDVSEMLRFNIVEVRHHADEIMEALKSGAEVEAWVLSRSDRAKTDMSDIAHYLDSSLKANTMASGGYMADGGMAEGYHQMPDGSTMANSAHMADGGMMAKGGKLKVDGDDFSFLLELSDKELSKRLDLVRMQQAINSNQYFEAREKGNSTSKIEEGGKQLQNQETAIIQARIMKKMEGGGYMAKGGDTEEGVDLFQDYKKIPKNVQMVLDKYEEDFEDGNYKGLALALKELEKIGYTFEYYLDGVAYDLRKIGQKGKSEYMADGGEMAKGGRLLSAINRDRAYKSQQEWEIDYKRKGRPKNPKYKTSYEMGGQAPVKKYPMLSNMKTDLIN
jgi:hypothetical protein